MWKLFVFQQACGELTVFSTGVRPSRSLLDQPVSYKGELFPILLATLSLGYANMLIVVGEN